MGWHKELSEQKIKKQKTKNLARNSRNYTEKKPLTSATYRKGNRLTI